MDACEIPDGRGGVVCPHENEWIESMPGIKQGEMRDIHDLQEFGPKVDALQAADGEEQSPEDVSQILEMTAKAFSGLVRMLAKRVTAWTLTDDFGEPLPAPHRNEAAFEDLRAVVLVYIMGLARELPADLEGNDGSPTPINSSVTGPLPSLTSSDSEPQPTSHKSAQSVTPSTVLQT